MINVAIHSAPRSGSTWLGSIFDSCPIVKYAYQPLFSYRLKDFLNESSSAAKITEFFQECLSVDDSFIGQAEAKEEGIVPTFTKTKDIRAVVYKEVRYHHLLHNMLAFHSELKVVGLVRNPLAVLNSWLNAKKEFRPDLGWKVEDEWLLAPKKNRGRKEEFNGYKKWVEVTKLFLDLESQYPDRFTLINYSDLLSDTENTVVQLFDFCDLPYQSQTRDFITDSQAAHLDDAYSVYKVKKDDNGWIDSLPRYIEDYLKQDADYIDINRRFKWTG